MAHENHDDPALKAALEASMRGQTNPQADFVDLTGDSDDESKSHTTLENVIDLENEEIDDDIKLAIALSMQEMQQPPPGGVLNGHGSDITDGTAVDIDKPTDVLPTLRSQPETVPPTVNFGIPGLDRKKLEEERLARVAKRKAESSISPPPLKRDSKVARRDVSPAHVSELKLTNDLPTTSAQALASPKKSAASRASTPESKPSKTTQPSSTPSPQFPKGVVKKTWAFGYSRDGDDIKIEEVLQTADLELAILSAFQWDMEWMFSKFRSPKTRFMLVMQAKEESTVSISPSGLERCEANNMIETTIP